MVNESCQHAIVCPPGQSFPGGLTSSGLGPADVEQAREQHAAYCRALEECGLKLTSLPADERYPDGTFVEDAAVVTEQQAILSNPGAPSRRGEIPVIRTVLGRAYSSLDAIYPPGTLEGGDVCMTDEAALIGLSERTNAEGARQLSALLKKEGRSVRTIDIRTIPGILHLKSGVAFLGERTLLAWDVLSSHPALAGYEIISVPPDEAYAANCVLVNGKLLFARGYPLLEKTLRDRGMELILLETSEFRKMDGGLSCLSLRF
jgi:dimethylargininase